MKHLIVTVGTSAIFNEEIGLVEPNRSNHDLRLLIKDYERSSDKSIAINKNVLDSLVRAHAQFWAKPETYKNTKNKRQRRQTSAELLSTYHLFTHQKAVPERVYLLASGTEEGFLAAEVVRQIMISAWGWKTVAVESVEKMHQKKAQEANQVHQNLIDCIDKTWNLKNESDVTINFTGGYKGTIPVLTRLASERGWPLFYQHEDNPESQIITFLKGDETKLVEVEFVEPGL
jgi:CRISPR/Cas system-associated protein Csm6